MMDISGFTTITGQGMTISQAQASRFAKSVAHDFNPIHDVGAKRFCVPGDLLFAALLNYYGVYQHLHVDLVSLVNADVVIKLPHKLSAENEIRDDNDRHLISLKVVGDSTNDKAFVANVVEQYVRFSGKTFPDILVELMQKNKVMINPSRPLVIYKDMSLKLDNLQADDLDLSLNEAVMDVDGKKGKVCLRFIIKDGNKTVGQGEKNMLLGGLQDFKQSAMDDIVKQYAARKTAYQQSSPQVVSY